MDFIEKENGEPIVWSFKKIISHTGPIDSKDDNYLGSSYNLSIEWENRETTEEPLSVIAADAPVAYAIYARENNLLNTPGWIRFKKIAQKQKQMFREVNQAKLKSVSSASKFKYKYEVPKNYNQALKIDKLNNNTKWQDAVQLKLKVIDDYKVLTDNGFNIPEGYKCITVNIIYDVKHDGKYKARLVAGGHLTDPPTERVYLGVV